MNWFKLPSNLLVSLLHFTDANAEFFDVVGLIFNHMERLVIPEFEIVSLKNVIFDFGKGLLVQFLIFDRVCFY